jgi:hypothetical protein
MAVNANIHTNILIELARTVKTLQFYPRGHPNLESTIANFHGIVKRAAEQGEIIWKVDKKGIFVDSTPLAPSHAASSVVTKILFFRKIRALTFSRAVTVEDLRTFLNLLVLTPEEVFSRGGAEKILARDGVTGVLLNEMSYRDVTELKEELKREKEVAPEEKKEEPPPPPEIPPKEETEETLKALLSRLEGETDILRYNDLAQRVAEKADPLAAQGLFEEMFPAITVFLKHSSSPHIDSGIRGKAEEKLKGFLRKEIIDYLVLRVGKRDDPERITVMRLLAATGEEAIEGLLGRLVETHDGSERRSIFNTLVYLGERIRGHAEARLADERWYVARQMVALLGALGGAGSLEALKKIYEHSDPRVKKEVLKALAQMPAEETREILIAALKDGDRALVGQAIISLGVLREHSAVDTLGEIATRKEPFVDDLEIRKEAVKALGIIRDVKAVKYLVRLLAKKSWFSRESTDELRSLAAASLGRIGGEEAIGAIEEASRNSTGRLYATCKKILEGAHK